MADQTIEIKLILRDELSRQLAPITAQLKQLSNAIEPARFQQATQHTQSFSRAIQFARRELSTLASITLGGLIGGGVVAGIVTAAKALGDMARQGMQLHYTAQSLGVSTRLIEGYSDAMMALGQSQEQGRAGIESAIGALRDLQVEGGKSNIFQTLEKGKGGKQLARELMAEMNGPRGMEGALQLLFRRMQGMNPEAQRSISKMFGLGTTGAKDLLDILPQLNKRVQLSVPEMKALNIAWANFQISTGNIGLMLGNALLPGLNKVMGALDKWMQTKAGKQFIDDLGAWGTTVADAIAKWVGDAGPNGLNANIEELKKGYAALKDAFGEADKTITQMGLTWPDLLKGVIAIKLGSWLLETGVGFAGLVRYMPLITALAGLTAYLHDPTKFREAIGDLRRRMQEDKEGAGKEDPEQKKEGFILDFLKQLLRGNIDLIPGGNLTGPSPKKQSYDDTGQSKTQSEQRADFQEQERANKQLIAALETTEYNFGKLNAYTAAGGPEGTPGISGYQFHPDDFNTPTFDRGPASQMPLAPRGSGNFSKWLQTLTPSTNVENRENEWIPGLSNTQRERFSQRQSIERGGKYLPGKFTDFGQPYIELPEDRAWLDDYFKRMGKPMESSLGVNWEKSFQNNPTFRAVEQRQELLRQTNSPNWSGPNPTNPFAPQRVGGDVGGGGSSDTIINHLARRDAGPSGSATVDIDVGSMGQTAERPPLFRDQPLGGVQQMQNISRPEQNPLSFE